MTLTRSDIVAAALQVLREQGLEVCSMRRIAAEVGVQPSALYHHVPSKQALLMLMADEIVAPVNVRAASAADVCGSLRDALLSIRDGAEVVSAAAAYREILPVESRLVELVGTDAARTLLLHALGHAQWTQTQLHAASFGLIDTQPSRVELDAAHARGVAIILAGVSSQGLQA